MLPGTGIGATTVAAVVVVVVSPDATGGLQLLILNVGDL
jgi:hypothetical protein